MSLQGIRARGVAIIAIDDSKFADERERPVRIVLSSAQAADLVRRLQAVVEDFCKDAVVDPNFGVRLTFEELSAGTSPAATPDATEPAHSQP
jgi:hypothetical protein